MSYSIHNRSVRKQNNENEKYLQVAFVCLTTQSLGSVHILYIFYSSVVNHKWLRHADPEIYPSGSASASAVKEGAKSFQGQQILQPGHPDELFSSKKVDGLFLVVALKIQAANAVSPSK